MADGYVVIDTELNSEGFKAGSAKLRAACTSLSGAAKKLGRSLKENLNLSGTTKKAAQEIASIETEAKSGSSVKDLEKRVSQSQKHINTLRRQLAREEQKLSPYYDEEAAIQSGSKALLKKTSTQEQRNNVLAMEQVEIENLNERYASQLNTVSSIQASLDAQLQTHAQITAELSKQKQLQNQPDAPPSPATPAPAVPKPVADSGLEKTKSDTKKSISLAERLKAAFLGVGKVIGKVGGLFSGLRASMAQSIKTPINGLSSSLKRLIPALLMTEGIFSLVRKSADAFMQQNLSLSATLNACWSGIGNILGPIISRIIGLIATAIAYITSFLSLLGIVGRSAAKEISKAGGGAGKEADKLKRQLASFDELNILTDNDSGGGGGGGGGMDAAEIEQKTLPDWARIMAEQIKAGEWARAAMTLTTQLNTMVSTVDWASVGANLGSGFNNALWFLATAIMTFDWKALGEYLGIGLNNAIQNVSWANLGVVLGGHVIALIGILSGLFTTLDWTSIGMALSAGFMGLWNAIDWSAAAQMLNNGIIGVLSAITTAIKTMDWQKIGNDVALFISTIDWSGVSSALFNGLGAALAGIGQFLIGLLGEKLSEIGTFLTSYADQFEAAGGDWTAGLLAGIGAGIAGIPGWIISNVVQPIIDGFKSGFGIASPSTVMTEQGHYVVDGLLLGITEAWPSITEFFNTVITDVVESIKTGWDNARSDTVEKWTEIRSAVESAWSEISSNTTESGTSISNSVSKAWSKAKEFVKSSLTETKATVKSSWSEMRSTTNSENSSMGTLVSSTFGSMQSVVSSKLSSISKAITSGFSSSSQTMISQMGTALTTISGQNWYGVGSDICSGIRSGLNAGWGWLSSTVSNLARSLLNSAKSALGIHSPSRLFRDEVGLNIGYGIGEGVGDSEGAVVKSVTGIADAIAEEMNAGAYEVGGIIPTTEIDGALTNFTDKIADSFTDLLARLQAIADGVSFRIPAAVNGVVPYQTSYIVNTASTEDNKSSEDIASVVIQSVTNATAAIVRAIEEHGGATINIDIDSLTDGVIEEINRRSMMNGESPLLI